MARLGLLMSCKPKKKDKFLLKYKEECKLTPPPSSSGKTTLKKSSLIKVKDCVCYFFESFVILKENTCKTEQNDLYFTFTLSSFSS